MVLWQLGFATVASCLLEAVCWRSMTVSVRQGGLSRGKLVQEAGGVVLWQLGFATVASCLLEAATTQLDNIFLPLHHLAMLAA